MSIRIIIISIVLAVVLLGIGAWFYSSSRTANIGKSSDGAQGGNIASPGELTPVNQAAIPPGATINFGTKQGKIAVSNFYKTAQGFDGGALVIRENAEYEIMYDHADSSFGILIFANSPDTARTAAENDFLSALGVSQTQACALSVSVALGGKEYPLSFCGAAGV